MRPLHKPTFAAGIATALSMRTAFDIEQAPAAPIEIVLSPVYYEDIKQYVMEADPPEPRLDRPRPHGGFPEPSNPPRAGARNAGVRFHKEYRAPEWTRRIGDFQEAELKRARKAEKRARDLERTEAGKKAARTLTLEKLNAALPRSRNQK